MSHSEKAAFEAIFHDTASRVFAYACRHVGRDDADDVVSETFVIAGRRRREIPQQPLPWLLVTARNVIRNHRRSRTRADQGWARSVRELWQPPDGAADAVLEARESAIKALRACTDQEREAVLLVAWDGLAPADAAAVAGCTQRAFTVRLSRARARLRGELDNSTAEPATSPPGTLRAIKHLKETT